MTLSARNMTLGTVVTALLSSTILFSGVASAEVAAPPVETTAPAAATTPIIINKQAATPVQQPAVTAPATDTVTATPLVGVLVAPAKLADADIEDFKKAPGDLLTANSNGGMAMSGKVRALVGSDPATLPEILALVPNANREQVEAIGSGLARAALLYAQFNPEYAAVIQTKVAEMANVNLSVAFTSITDEVQTAALGAAGSTGGQGGGAPGIGGGDTAGGGSQGIFRDETTPSDLFVGRQRGIQRLFTAGNDGSGSLVSPN